MKRCNACKEIKPKTEFNLRKESKDRLQYICKKCQHSAGREYYKKNPNRYKERYQKWAKLNPERVRKFGRQAYAKTPEKHKARARESAQKRRAAKYNNGPIDKGINIEDVYVRDKGICGICKEKCTQKEQSMDHIIPLSKNGTHTWGNIQLAHLTCNISKGNNILNGGRIQ